MQKKLRRMAFGLVAMSVILVLLCWFTLRGSLPALDGTISSNALADTVTLERDALGTVTLQGASRADVSWALGFVHAQERFFEMDLMRRSAAGELAELFGAAALPSDRRARVHRMRARAASTLALAAESERQLIERYRDGVNAGLAALNVRPFPYLLTRSTPRPWTSEDTVLVVDSMYFTLSDAGNARELAFSAMKAALPESAFRFLTATGGSWDAPLSGPPMAGPCQPRLPISICAPSMQPFARVGQHR